MMDRQELIDQLQKSIIDSESIDLTVFREFVLVFCNTLELLKKAK